MRVKPAAVRVFPAIVLSIGIIAAAIAQDTDGGATAQGDDGNDGSGIPVIWGNDGGASAQDNDDNGGGPIVILVDGDDDNGDNGSGPIVILVDHD